MPICKEKFYIPNEIIEQSDKWGIKEYLITAISLVNKHFPSFHDITFSLQRDYEIDDEWITIDVSIDGDIEEELDSYDKYTENFVYEIPWPERDKIRLSC